MMKRFARHGLSAAILSALSLGVSADTMQLEELPTAENYRFSFPQSLNEQGMAVGISRFPLGLDIDLSQVSEVILANAGIDDIEEVDSLTPEQYDYIISSLAINGNSNLEQLQVGLHTAFYYDGMTQSVPLVNDPPEISADTFLYDINANNTAVGSASGTFSPEEFTYTNGDDEEVSSTFYLRDYISRGVWYRNGQVSLIEPPETAELGGESAILDVNDSGLAAGYASISISGAAQDRIDACTPEQEEAIVSRPTKACVHAIWQELYSKRASNIAPSFYSQSDYAARRSIYNIRGYLWQLDNNGEVISQTQLGTLMDRQEDDDRDFSSYAFAVNNNGNAVGQSWTYHVNRGAVRMPAVFQNGEAQPVTQDEKYYWGAATDINDSDRAVGYLVENRAGDLRNTGFYYDLDSEELVPVPGFFSGSSTVPNAINDNGIMVGTGEIEPTLQSTRRRVGFWYDTTAEDAEFVNLNNTLSCDSEYFIVEANDVTDSGEVLATALKEVEYVDGDGETQTREVSVSIKLNPIDGELNNCREEENKVERSGASVGATPFAVLAVLGGFITFMRRKAKLKIKKS